MSRPDFLEISPEVSAALQNKQGVVALESTLIAHGMPYPKNVETALALEEVVRENGAWPATIAVLSGKLKAGLSLEELQYLGERGPRIPKASRRDLPVLAARGSDGATTVAATMIIARWAGISVFCTGGIGGVHRGAEKSLDISADLEELAQTPVVVVCAGAKAVLDLGLTLEYLETKGVPVLGYQTEELPAFYSRESGYKVDYQVNTPKEIAAVWKMKQALSLRGGLVVANPIPEEFALSAQDLDGVIEGALGEAERRQIRGKEVTPFLLAWIEKETGGLSLEANSKLVQNNGALAARIAVEFARLV